MKPNRMTQTFSLPLHIPILDKGFVELQDVMGNDNAIVAAARVSYLGESKGEDQDKKLIDYLMRHEHTSPFEMVQFKLRVKCPLFIARQWQRHRTWHYMSVNEVSRRYTSEEIDFYIPETWRTQHQSSKQCSDGVVEAALQEKLTQQLLQHVEQAMNLYQNLVDQGVAREQARMVLPQNMYTTFIANVNAHNLLHFLKLRLDIHAQYEIRIYAEAIYQHFVKLALPWTAEAAEKYLFKQPVESELC
jgi:thymidylate synthase (FAD)